MRWKLMLLAGLSLVACESVSMDALREMRPGELFDADFFVPKPDYSDLSQRVEPDQLAAFMTEVTTRPDAECAMVDESWQACRILHGTEIYFFTADAHTAHPSALYRGYRRTPKGMRFEEKGWSAADADAAAAFFAMAGSGEIQPRQ